MANSLMDQLLKAGVASEKQAKKVKHEKRAGKGGKKGRQASPATQVDAAALAARQAAAAKAERDRRLNLERKAAAEQKALAAQVRQLIAQNRLPREGAGEAYHFTDGRMLKSLPVTPAQRAQLARGQLDIVRDGEAYELVSAEVAEKIRARDASRVMARPAAESKPDADDPYAGYEVPDDLIW